MLACHRLKISNRLEAELFAVQKSQPASRRQGIRKKQKKTLLSTSNAAFSQGNVAGAILIRISPHNEHKKFNAWDISSDKFLRFINLEATKTICIKSYFKCTTMALIAVIFFFPEISYCYKTPCRNGGTCTETDTGFECVCPSQWNCIDCSCSGRFLTSGDLLRCISSLQHSYS